MPHVLVSRKIMQPLRRADPLHPLYCGGLIFLYNAALSQYGNDRWAHGPTFESGTVGKRAVVGSNSIGYRIAPAIDSDAVLEWDYSRGYVSQMIAAGAFTTAIYCRATGTNPGGTSYNRVAHRLNDNTGGGRWAWLCSSSAAATPNCLYFVARHLDDSNWSGASSWAHGSMGLSPEVYFITCDGSTLRQYRSGKLYDSSAFASSGSTPPTYPFRFGADALGANGPTVEVIGFAWWRNRTLSSREVREISRNWWGLYQPRRRLVFFPPPSGLSATIGQAVEADAAQAITRVKALAVAQATETDTAQAITRRKVNVLGQATETDTAQAVTRLAANQIQQVEEVDTAQVVARGKRKALGQTVETDAAQAVTRRKARVVGQVAETDAAQSVTRRKARAVGQVAETDLAQPVAVSGSKVIAVGQVAETDAAQPVSWAPKKRAVAQVVETDLAQMLTARRTRGIAQATETDAARPILKVAGGAIGLALEIDIGRPITPAPHRLIGAVFETDLALEVEVTSGQFLDEPFFSHTLAAESRRIGHADPSADSRRIGHTDMSFRRPF